MQQNFETIKQNASHRSSIGKNKKFGKSMQMEAVAKMQEQLYKIGAFDGLSYKKAVDGYNGKLTQKALKRAEEKGYKWNDATGKLEKKIKVTSEQATNAPTVTQQPKINMEAITSHKVNTGVTDPYVVVDKQNNRMYLMKGDSILENHEITLGANRGDGYHEFSDQTPYYGNMPRTTGAGVYTVRKTESSPYPGFGANPHEPMYFLIDGNRRKSTSMAIHAPAGKVRAKLFNDGNSANNRASYGCISPDLGVVQRWSDNKLLNSGDSVYVIPETKGNYMTEQNGKIITVFGGTNPSTYKNDGRDIGFYYNMSK